LTRDLCELIVEWGWQGTNDFILAYAFEGGSMATWGAKLFRWIIELEVVDLRFLIVINKILYTQNQICLK